MPRSPRRALLALAALAVSALPLRALEPPRVFSDHMVLQQARPLPAWGRAEPAARIQAVIRFTPGGGGLWILNGGELQGFTLAGADGVFHPATATLQGKDTVEVSSPAVPAPEAVRYAWAKNTRGANLVNRQRLPAPTFELRKPAAATAP